MLDKKKKGGLRGREKVKDSIIISCLNAQTSLMKFVEPKNTKPTATAAAIINESLNANFSSFFLVKGKKSESSH